MFVKMEGRGPFLKKDQLHLNLGRDDFKLLGRTTIQCTDGQAHNTEQLVHFLISDEQA